MDWTREEYEALAASDAHEAERSDLKIRHWVEGTGNDAAVYWETSDGLCGHGSPIGEALANAWAKHGNEQYN